MKKNLLVLGQSLWFTLMLSVVVSNCDLNLITKFFICICFFIVLLIVFDLESDVKNDNKILKQKIQDLEKQVTELRSRK